MKDWDPFQLSRELGKLARRTRALERELSRGLPTLDPFAGRDWPGKSLFDELLEIDQSDPLRRPLLRWAHHLIDERVQLPWRAHEAWLLFEELHGVRVPRDGEFSLAELTRLALRTSGAERRGFLDARASRTERLGAHRSELWARRAEVARRLGLAHADELLGPLEDRARVESLAVNFLELTRDAAQQSGVCDFASFVEALLAPTASEALPARLAPHALRTLLGAELLRGVNLEPFALPERLAPSSFPLAFERLGQAWAEALLPSDFPYVVAHDPARLTSLRDGVLLASWWCRRPFLRRRLGVSRDVASSQSRAFLGSFVLEGRRRASAVLLRGAALAGQKQLEQQAAELSVGLFGEELTAPALLGCLDVKAAAASEFVGFLAAIVRNRQFVEEYDDDYFDDPRATEHLKDEAGRVPALTFAVAEIEPAAHLLARDWAEAF